MCTAMSITYHWSKEYVFLYFVWTKEEPNLPRLVFMTHIICSRDIYVTYQNQTEHKEGKKKKK